MIPYIIYEYHSRQAIHLNIMLYVYSLYTKLLPKYEKYLIYIYLIIQDI